MKTYQKRLKNLDKLLCLSLRYKQGKSNGSVTKRFAISIRGVIITVIPVKPVSI